jgi:hypothetical protein
MAGRVVLRTYNSRGEAEAARAFLEGHDVEAFVESDDCGAVDPALAFVRGVKLTVDEEFGELAARLLSEIGSP